MDIPASALKPNEKRYPLHEAETVEKSNQIKALIREQQEAVALAGDDKDRLCRHKLIINELRKKLAEVDALLGRQERGVA